MPRHWLMKSEPGSYGIEDLERDGSTSWEGVRNYQARNFMRDEMREGDAVLFYHSSVSPPGVAGVARVAKAGYPDATARNAASPYYDEKASEEDPRWYRVDIAFERRFAELVPLATLRETAGLEAMPLLDRSRLSVMPVTAEEFRIIGDLAR